MADAGSPVRSAFRLRNDWSLELCRAAAEKGSYFHYTVVQLSNRNRQMVKNVFMTSVICFFLFTRFRRKEAQVKFLNIVQIPALHH